MINDIRNFHFYNSKNSFSGSHGKMRFFINPIEKEEGKRFQVTVWPEPFCLEKTPEEDKICAEFPFNEEGMEQVKGWLEEQYKLNETKW